MKISITILLLFLFSITYSQTSNQNQKSMKLNAGIITENFSETRDFYTKVLGFGVSFENDFYLLLHTPNHQAEISFLKPDHPTQAALFQKPFAGNGVYLTIEVENVDEVYQQIKAQGINIEIELRDEPWGDRHFAIKDPNGIGVDLVTYTTPKE